jgi:bacillithiol synthase
MISYTLELIPRNDVFGMTKAIEDWEPTIQKEFLSNSGTAANIIEQIKIKTQNFTKEDRINLQDVLLQQYKDIELTIAVKDNIAAITNPKTFTISTGHQLNLAMGPLYLIYKILHTIRMVEELNTTHTENHFVPVFWMASEDHDFQEIQSVHLFSKTFTWDKEPMGAIGRFDTEGLKDVYQEIIALFSEPLKEELNHLFNTDIEKYAKHFRRCINTLFSKFGLLIIDGDNIKLKSKFIPIFKKEIRERFLASTVSATNRALIAKGIQAQAHVRPINIFHLSNGKRSRLIEQNNKIIIDDQALTIEEVCLLIDMHPEQFSPNVLLRPLYQESVLPNLCYIGGNAELNYWAQLKSSFSAVKLPFPILRTRFSAFILTPKMKGSAANLYSLFKPIDQQINELMQTESERDQFFSEIDAISSNLKQAMEKGLSKFGSDASRWSDAQIAGIEKNLGHWKQRWQREEKQRLETAINRIEKINRELYPSGIPQERHWNFLHVLGQNNISDWLCELKNKIKPFSSDIHIFVQNHETE